MSGHATNEMAGKIVLVTGGSGGIGKETALGCARQGARVGIVGRNRHRTESTAAKIKDHTGAEVDVFIADMSSMVEVRRLAAEVQDTYPRLDVLVNNVGGVWSDRRVTVDGHEHTFAVNHLAPFLLTTLLLDLLKRSAPARIVTVASSTHSLGRINFDDLHGATRYSGLGAYNQSKLANILFTYELARQLEGTGVTATVLHPGVVRTSFLAEEPPALFKLVRLGRSLMKAPHHGAATSIHLASSPEVEGVNGRYFVGKKAKKTSRRSRNLETARRLWHVSTQLTSTASR